MACRYHSDLVFENRPVLVSLTVLEVLVLRFYSLVWEGAQLLSAYSSLQRIEAFLLEPERSLIVRIAEDDQSPSSSSDFHSEKTPEKEGFSTTPVSVIIRNAAIGLNGIPFLASITATIPSGKLTMLCGTAVGVGKTSLLLAILREYDTTSGSIHVTPAQPRIAYCSQDSVVHSEESIRQNILFHLPYCEERYSQILLACALTSDLAEMVEGDRTKANGLSGGQRQRISLARALYADTQLVLLDDVLSALDNVTEQHVFNALFGSQGLLANKTVIFASNDIKRFSHADHIFLFDPSGFIGQGSYADISLSYPVFRSLAESQIKSQAGVSDLPSSEILHRSLDVGLQDKSQGIEDEADSTSHGGVAAAIIYYISNGGWQLNFGLLLTLVAAWPLFQSGFAIYVRLWTKNSSNGKDQKAWLWITGLLCLSVFYLLSASAWWLNACAKHPIESGRRVHKNQTSALLNSGIAVYDKFTTGYL